MQNSGLDIWSSFKKKLESPGVRWSVLSSLLLLSIVSSHFIFSTQVEFKNDIPINYQSVNKSKLEQFKIPVFDMEAKQRIISLTEYKESRGDFIVLHPEKNLEISKLGLKCKVLNLDEGHYRMKCYNISPENKGFGMYTSNTYKVIKSEDNNGTHWNVERVRYKEVFLLSYFFGFIFWGTVFFWPIVFSKNESNDVENVSSVPTVTS